MKKWQALLLITLILAVLSFSVSTWLPPLLDFAGANGDLIQSLDSFLSILLEVGAIFAGLYAFLTKKKAKTSSVQKINTEGGAYIGRNVATGGGAFTGRDKNIRANGGVASGRDMTGNTIIHAEQVVLNGVANDMQKAIKNSKLSKKGLKYISCFLNRFLKPTPFKNTSPKVTLLKSASKLSK